MKKSILGLLLCMASCWSFGQGWSPMGARSMSMANASVTNNDVWAYHHNPAALADMEEFAVGISYENRFLLKELQSQGLSVAIPLKVGVISVGGQTFGYREFRTYKGGLGYSMKLSKHFFAGVQFNYQGLQLSQNYGTASSVTAEAGVYAKISEKWKVGMSVFNLGRAKLSEFEDDRFSTIMRLGTSYCFSEKVTLAVEFDKDLDYDFRFKTGLEYQVLNNFFVRGGVATTPVELSLGFGYHLKSVQIALGSAYHQTLGWSPHFSLVYQRSSKK